MANDRLKNDAFFFSILTCASVCVLCTRVFIKSHVAAQSGPLSCETNLSYLILVHSKVFMCVCVRVFSKLHITAQSGPVILVVLCHSH